MFGLLVSRAIASSEGGLEEAAGRRKKEECGSGEKEEDKPAKVMSGSLGNECESDKRLGWGHKV